MRPTRHQREPGVSDLPPCPKCNSGYTYEQGDQLICPECGHEWAVTVIEDIAEDRRVVRDANGNELADGDTVVVIKDLKVKGSSSVVKLGTRVKGIRLVDGAGGHDIDCRIEGIGAMQLKSEFVRKS